MFCCPNCFADSFLKNHISAISEKKGQCSFCGHKTVALLDPADLADRFEPLFDLYEKDRQGSPLIEIIQEDWNVLAAFRKSAQKRLLSQLARDNDLLTSKHKPVFLHDKTNIEQWEKFRLELKHKMSRPIINETGVSL